MRYELETTQTGCAARLEGDLSVEIERPHLDKAILRGTLTVRRKMKVIHRDTVNLTSERARKKLIDRLVAEKVEIGDGKLLVALDEACRRLIGEEEANSSTEPRPAHLSYQATEHGLIHLKLTRDGEILETLTNFTAKIVGEVVRDDGVETHRSFELETRLGGQRKRFDVPASSFQAMGWVTEKLGPSAIVYAGFGTKDHARAAIQVLSGGDIPSRNVYTHLGWREIEGKLYYLHAGGPIGPIGPIPSIEVEPPPALMRYTLPPPPGRDELIASVQASMKMLEILPLAVTLPIYCAVWRAAAGPCDFTLHLSGQTGVGKTEVAALAQQHYGQGMDARNLPASWSSTGNALEVLAFAAKDALLVVDDFAPEGSSYDIQRLHKEAARLLRAQGNRSGRQRLRPDATLRPEKHPRGLILSTGEDIPRAHSVRARILTLEVSIGALNWDLLTVCQSAAAAGLYAQAFAGYLRWLSGHYNDLEVRRQRKLSEYRGRATSGHRRTSMIEAELIFGLDLFLAFAVDAGVLTGEEADGWMDEGIAALREATSAQAQHLAAADPVRRFLELLQSGIGSGKAHLASPKGDSPGAPTAWGWRRKTIGAGLSEREEWQPQGTCVGWIEDDDIYLNPEAAHRTAEQLTTGEGLNVLAKTLWKRMRERSVLASVEPNHNTVRRRLQGQRRRVLHLKTRTLMPEESVQSVQSVPGGGNSGARGPIPGTDSGPESLQSVQEIGPEKPTEQGAEQQSGPIGPIGPILEGQDTQEESDTFLEV